MIELKNVVEIDDLQREIKRISGKSYDEVEKAFEDNYLDPEGRVCYLSLDSSNLTDIEDENPEQVWLYDAFKVLFSELPVDHFYFAFF